VGILNLEQVEHTISEETWNHELSTVADGVNGTVLDDDSLVGSEKGLERSDDLSEVRLVSGVVLHPLGIKDIMKSDHVLLLVHSTRSNTSKLLHVSTNAQQETQVHTESTDVGTGLTADPENTQVALIVEFVKLALVNGSDTELSLDSGDQRWTLEKSTSQGLQSARKLCLSSWELVVQSNDTDVLLTGSLLGLDQTRSAVNADNQTSSNLWIEGTTVTSLLNSEHALDPSNDFVRGWVGGLVKVNDTGADVGLQVALEWSATVWNWGEVTSTDKDCSIVSAIHQLSVNTAKAYACRSSSTTMARCWYQQQELQPLA
jgi:hypothetical protein